MKRIAYLVDAQFREFARNAMSLLMGPAMMIFISAAYRLGSLNSTSAAAIMVPMTLIVCAYMVGWMLLAMSLAEEREKRTLEALLLTPTRPGEVVLAKMLVIGLASVFTAVLCMSFWGLPARFGVTVLGFLLTLIFAMAGGLLVGTLASDQKTVGLSTPLWLVVMFTGFEPMFHAWPQGWAIMAYLPTRPAMSLLHAGWFGQEAVAVRDIGVLLAYILLLTVICIRVLRKQAFAR